MPWCLIARNTAVIGTFAQAVVAEEVRDNRFAIATSLPNAKGSWQETGIRRDAYAEKNRIPVEGGSKRGSYLHPAAFGRPEEQGESARERVPARASLTGLRRGVAARNGALLIRDRGVYRLDAESMVVAPGRVVRGRAVGHSNGRRDCRTRVQSCGDCRPDAANGGQQWAPCG
jgi:hypothetical protein